MIKEATMSKKLAVIYGAAISLLVSIHIFTFFYVLSFFIELLFSIF